MSSDDSGVDEVGRFRLGMQEGRGGGDLRQLDGGTGLAQRIEEGGAGLHAQILRRDHRHDGSLQPRGLIQADVEQQPAAELGREQRDQRHAEPASTMASATS